jgi:hypothetical protein
VSWISNTTNFIEIPLPRLGGSGTAAGSKRRGLRAAGTARCATIRPLGTEPEQAVASHGFREAYFDFCFATAVCTARNATQVGAFITASAGRE